MALVALHLCCCCCCGRPIWGATGACALAETTCDDR